MLFVHFQNTKRTTNDDYEISIGFGHDNIYVNRQWKTW